MTNYELHIPKALQKTVLTNSFNLPSITSANGNLQKLPYCYKVSDKKDIFIK